MSDTAINTAVSPGTVGGGNQNGTSSSSVQASPQSALANAMEELGSAVSERRNRTKDEAINDDKADKNRLNWIENIQQYLQQIPDLEKQQKLLSFVSANLGRSNTADEFIQNLKSFSDEEGLQYIAGKILAESSDPGDKRHFEEALDGFLTQHHKAIAIALNTSAAFAEQLPAEDIARARTEYRTITDYQSHSKAWRELQSMAKEYGSVEAAIEIHQKALSADYNSLAPSDDKSLLGQVMQNLGQLKQLNTVYSMVGDVASLIQRQFFIAVDAAMMMERLLTFPDNQIVSQSQLATMMKRLGITMPDAQVVVVQEMRKIAMALPDGLYPTAEHRSRVMTSLQDGIDKAIKKEEEWLDAQ